MRKVLAKIIISVFIFSLVFFLGLLIVSEETEAAPQKVNYLKLTYNLSGKIYKLEGKELVVMFSRDMKALGGQRDPGKIMSIEPKVKGKFMWRGNSTLVFKPMTRFHYSTRYRVTIPKNTRSRDGKRLEKTVSWEFSTPTVAATHINYANNYVISGNRDNVSRHFQSEKMAKAWTFGPIYYKEPVTLSFNQGITLPELKKHLQIIEDKTGAPAPFTCTRLYVNRYRIEFTEPLVRGGKYKVILTPGLHGFEGPVPTDREFHFYLSTVPPFSCLPEPDRKMRADQTDISVEFSNPILPVTAGQLEITRHTGEKREPLNHFSILNIKSLHRTGRTKMTVRVFDRLRPGDQLSIGLKKPIKSIYGDTLDSLKTSVRVCSGFPTFAVENGDGKFWFRFQYIKNATVDLYKLNRDFLHYLNVDKDNPGVILTPGFKKKYAGKTKTLTVEPQGSAEDFSLIPLDIAKGIGGGTGFYGLGVREAAFDNECKDELIREFGDEPGKKHPGGLYVVHRRNHDFVLRVSAKNMMLFAYKTPDRRGRHFLPLARAPVTIIRTGKNGKIHTVKLGQTNRDGLLFKDFTLKKNDKVVVTHPESREIAFYAVRNNNLPHRDRDLFMANVFTDKQLYRPGQTVHVFGVLRGRTTSGQLFKNIYPNVRLRIRNVRASKSAVDKVIETDAYGAFRFDFVTAVTATKGLYQIEIDAQKGRADDFRGPVGYGSFRLDDYQPDTFRVKIKNMDKIYFKGGSEKLAPTILGQYLSGNPMSGGFIEYTLRLNPGISYDFKQKHGLHDYDFNLARDFIGKPLDIKKEAELDSRGEYRLSLTDLSSVKYPADIFLGVTAETEEGKEVWTSASAGWFPGQRLTGIKPDHYSYKAKSPASIDLKVIDTRGRNASASADVTFMYVHPGQRYYRRNVKRKLEAVRQLKNIRLKGKCSVSFTPPRPGTFLVKIDTRDKKGNVTSTSAEFQVRGIKAPKDDSFYVEKYKSKKNYDTGDVVSLRIRCRRRGKALVTVSKDKFIDTRIIDLNQKTGITPLDIKVKPSYFPQFKVNVTALFPDGRTSQYSNDFVVTDPAKQLHVELKPSAPEIVPSSGSSLDVYVKNHRGKGKKARVFVYAVNEGSLQMSNYRVPDLYAQFYYKDMWQLRMINYELHSVNQRLLALYPSKKIKWLAPGTRVNGRVTDSAGNPIDGVRVLMIYHKYYRQNEKISCSVYTGPDGQYDFGFVSEPYVTFIYAKKGFKPYHYSYRKPYPVPKVIKLQPVKPPPKPVIKKKKAKPAPVKVTVSPDADKLPFRGGGPSITGTIRLDDGTEVPGVLVALELAGTGKKRTTVTSEKGVYRFLGLPTGAYKLTARLEGFKTIVRKGIEVEKDNITLDLVMGVMAIQESVVVSGKAPTVDRVLSNREKKVDPGLLNESDFLSMLRKDFREVLFFEVVETGRDGHAHIKFRSSDTLSTYRIMAVACTDKEFGSGQEHVRVSKPMLLEEAMPEFARIGDRFVAGFRVGNRTKKTLTVSVKNKPTKAVLKARGNPIKTMDVGSKDNQWVWFDFEAVKPGTEELHFYAASGPFKDALLKKIPVYPRWVSESLLDFDSGEQLDKAVKPQTGAYDQTLLAEVSSTMLQPAEKIRRRLSRYPYGCLEQRTSKIIPWIILDQDFLDRTAGDDRFRVSGEKVKRMIADYISYIPRYKYTGGGLSYFQGSSRVSDYLTVYVLWALRMAREKFPDLDTGVEGEIYNYLSRKALDPVPLCFFQYVRSIDRKADESRLEELFVKRETLPLMARAFLYRAIHHQRMDGAQEMTKKMTAEFNNGLMIEADFAYFDAGEFEDHYEYPFYSSRYTTALLMQAVLEVEGEYVPAPRMIRWLLETKPYEWFATQTNFWILYAANQYYRIYEKDANIKAVLKLLGDTHKKTFTAQDYSPLKVKKSLGNRKEEFPITLNGTGSLYLTTELNYKLIDPPAKNRGIEVQRNIYDETGKHIKTNKDGQPLRFEKGKRYMVELLITPDKEVPYGVIDEPLAAGFQVLRQDIASSTPLRPFNNSNRYLRTPWLWRDHSPDRIVFYSYLINGQMRIIYYIKAMYRGTFTWLPAVVQGMYHPQYFGRNGTYKVVVH